MTIRIIGLTALLLISNGSFASASDEPERITLVVRLVDYSQLSVPIRRAAQGQVTRIFAAAGVNIAWSPDPTGDPADRQAVNVLVLSNAMSDRQISAESIPARVLGHVIHSIRRAYILTERVMDLADRVGVDRGDALGDIIAHEIGHLLLGVNGHSASGLMEADYAIGNKASRRFTAHQATVIRERLVRDAAAPSASR